jgi:hypothetical protein
MTYKAGDRVNRIEVRSVVSAVVLNTQDGLEGQFLQLAYAEGGTGWWPADAVKPLSAT